MTIRRFVEERVLPVSAEVAHFSLKGFARMVGHNGVLERVYDLAGVDVTLQSWAHWDETEVIVEAMLASAETHAVRVLNYSAFNHTLWPKLHGYMRFFVVSPDVLDKIQLPGPPAEVIVSKQVPPNRVLCGGPRAGTLFIRGDELGYVVPDGHLRTIHVHYA